MGTAKYAKDYFRELANSAGDSETTAYYCWRTIRAIEASGQQALDFSNQDLVLLAAEDRFSDVAVVLMEMVFRGQIKMVHDKDGVLCLEITSQGLENTEMLEPEIINGVEFETPHHAAFVESLRGITGEKE